MQFNLWVVSVAIVLPFWQMATAVLEFQVTSNGPNPDLETPKNSSQHFVSSARPRSTFVRPLPLSMWLPSLSKGSRTGRTETAKAANAVESADESTLKEHSSKEPSLDHSTPVPIPQRTENDAPLHRVDQEDGNVEMTEISNNSHARTNSVPQNHTHSDGKKRVSSPVARMTKDDSKMAIQYILSDPDLSELAEAMKRSGISSDSIYSRAAATIFAPTNEAFAKLPVTLDALQTAGAELPGGKNVTYTNAIFGYHIIAPRQINPKSIKAGLSYIAKTRTSDDQELTIQRISNDDSFRVNHDATVVEVVNVRRGYVYKINSFLYKRWNNGPSIRDYLRDNSKFSRLNFLLERSIFNSYSEKIGPITMLIIPDDGWRLGGVKIPECVFEGLVRPENDKALRDVINWLTLPGIWTSNDLRSMDSVATLGPREISISHTHRYDSRTKPSQFSTLIDGVSVIDWDISVFNGIAHELAALPQSGPFNLLPCLWTCVDQTCHECPFLTKHILKFLDKGGLFPSPKEPLKFIVPDGPRPSWVCLGAANYFAPGWEPVEWQRYVAAAEMNDPRAEAIAKRGYEKAAHKIQKLEEDLEDAELKLKRLESYGPDWSDATVVHRADPAFILSKIKTSKLTREFGIPTGCSNEESPRDLTQTDLSYLVRWMN